MMDKEDITIVNHILEMKSDLGEIKEAVRHVPTRDELHEAIGRHSKMCTAKGGGLNLSKKQIGALVTGAIALMGAISAAISQFTG